MSHPMLNAAVAQTMVDNLMREHNSPEGQLRSRLAYERRLRRDARRVDLRARLARSLHWRPRVEEHELAA